MRQAAWIAVAFLMLGCGWDKALSPVDQLIHRSAVGEVIPLDLDMVVALQSLLCEGVGVQGELLSLV